MAIPASDIVTINPSVLGAGGNALALNGLILTKNTALPTGGVQTFGNASAVGDYFGTSSDEYTLASVYFSGYDGSAIKPSTLIFAPYNDAARAAWIKSGSLSTMTLTQLQALTGTLIVTVDGTAFTSSTINLATATSFSDAATKITAGFTGTGKPTCTWNAVGSTFQLTSATTGATSTIGYCTGTLATSLKFTSATAAILSQGAVVDTITTCMTTVTNATQNWASFMTLWEPVTADKVLIATWANGQNSRYMYVAWDTDGQAIVSGSTTAFGAVAKAAKYDGVMCVYNTKELAAFVLGTIASIDFSRRNGRITAAFKSQSGLAVTCSTKSVADILLANGYSFYGTYNTANDSFNFLYSSQLTGKWLWLDEFVNEVYLNSQLQLALLSLLTNIGSVPYNNQGYSLIRAAMSDPIESARNFGAMRSGVALSNAQKAIINSSAGLDVSGDLYANAYYLQILDPTSQVRAARGTPVINLWYTSGGAVHKISLPSIDVI
jgi:hypothetical protein